MLIGCSTRHPWRLSVSDLPERRGQFYIESKRTEEQLVMTELPNERERYTNTDLSAPPAQPEEVSRARHGCAVETLPG